MSCGSLWLFTQMVGGNKLPLAGRDEGLRLWVLKVPPLFISQVFHVCSAAFDFPDSSPLWDAGVLWLVAALGVCLRRWV